MANFSFLTNHGKALLLIAGNAEIRIRDIAVLLDLTERAAQRIVSDLVEGGYIDRHREGRRNRYEIKPHLPLGLPQRDAAVGALVALVRPAGDGPET